jgi:hypothetical protein
MRRKPDETRDGEDRLLRETAKGETVKETGYIAARTIRFSRQPPHDGFPSAMVFRRRLLVVSLQTDDAGT